MSDYLVRGMSMDGFVIKKTTRLCGLSFWLKKTTSCAGGSKKL